MVERLFATVGPDSPAAPSLAAGLSWIGEVVAFAPAAEEEETRRLAAFSANGVLSSPTGFSTCNETLSDGYRFLRLFQQAFEGRDPAIPVPSPRRPRPVTHRRAVAYNGVDSGCNPSRSPR